MRSWNSYLNKTWGIVCNIFETLWQYRSEFSTLWFWLWFLITKMYIRVQRDEGGFKFFIILFYVAPFPYITLSIQWRYMLHLKIQLFSNTLLTVFQTCTLISIERPKLCSFHYFSSEISFQILKGSWFNRTFRNLTLRKKCTGIRVCECNTQTQDKTTLYFTIIGDYNESNNIFPFKQNCFTNL